MGYSRKIAPEISPESDALTSAMVGIGMNFAAPRIADPNIEDTLLFSSIEGMDHHDLRVLAVLVTWFGIHAPWVNADRLTKIVATQTSSRVRALWSVLGRWQSRGTIVDRRFARLAKVYTGPRINLLPVGTEFHVGRHGEDPRFEGSSICAPANILRDRSADVLSPAELAKVHRAYRYRWPVAFHCHRHASRSQVVLAVPSRIGSRNARTTASTSSSVFHWSPSSAAISA